MAIEYRGCKRLVYAEVTKDDASGYTTGAVKTLAPVQEIAKTVETSSAVHYYDNKGAVVIDSEGADTVTFTIAIPSDAVLAEITGRTYDSTKKAFIESKRKKKVFAVGYVLGEVGDDADDQYVWRYKGSFNDPDVSAKTEDDGTDASNMSLVFTGIYTEYEFANGEGTGNKGSSKAMKIRKSDNIATEDQWFAEVVTPDTTIVISG